MAKKTRKKSEATDFPLMSVEEILKSVRKQHGETSVMTYKNGVNLNVETISFGSLIIDEAVGVGGAPKGRMIEIYGPESSGKTTVCLSLIAEAQKLGDKCAFVDTEHAMDLSYAKKLGVDVENLILSQPDSGEQALAIAQALISTGNISVLIIDSVAALVPEAEINGEMGDSHVGLQARLMSQACRKLTSLIKKTNTIVMFTNQLREKIGVMYGSPEVTSGGKALKFYASIRMDIRKIGTRDEEGQPFRMKDASDDRVADCNIVKIKIVKNKVAPPFKVAETDIFFGYGFDKNTELFNLCVKRNIITKKGSWYSYGEKNLGQGLFKSVETVDDLGIYDELLEAYHHSNEDEDEEIDEGLQLLYDKLEELTQKQLTITEQLGEAKGSSKKKLERSLEKLDVRVAKVEKKINNYE